MFVPYFLSGHGCVTSGDLGNSLHHQPRFFGFVQPLGTLSFSARNLALRAEVASPCPALAAHLMPAQITALRAQVYFSICQCVLFICQRLVCPSSVQVWRMALLWGIWEGRLASIFGASSRSHGVFRPKSGRHF